MIWHTQQSVSTIFLQLIFNDHASVRIDICFLLPMFVSHWQVWNGGGVAVLVWHNHKRAPFSCIFSCHHGLCGERARAHGFQRVCVCRQRPWAF